MDHISVLSPKSPADKVYRSSQDVVKALRPTYPIHILSRKILQQTAQQFKSLFGGTVMYAVKSNPHKDVIKTLYKSGINCFDAASIDEIRLVRKYAPRASIHFMHPVKSREAIREAYFVHGVRVFVIDCVDELHKILQETALANDIEIYVRLALPKNKQASVDFSSKFGATPVVAIQLLQQARLVCCRLGVMFHPGTQSRTPKAFVKAVGLVARVIKEAGVQVDALDIGGGFPALYKGHDDFALHSYIGTIEQAIAAHKLGHLDLYCEPGRALVAAAGSLITRVEQRKENTLYLNDGIYGGLVEAAAYQGGFQYPTEVVFSNPQQHSDEMLEFHCFGPTCDSLDRLAHPLTLSAKIKAGDWVIFHMTGAYSYACRTNFNGFGKHQTILI